MKVKVQKRDGRIVEYNADKITAAIKKANVEVDNSQKVSDDLIEEAIGNVEKTDKEVIPVETIQDIIEKTLVAHNKYVLAKKYMIYRYQRSLLRKSNTTDESILKLIRNENKELAEENSNKNTVHASTQPAKCRVTSQDVCCCRSISQWHIKTAYFIFMTRIILYSRFLTAVL